MQNQTTDNTWNKITGKWEQLKGSVRKQWGKLTEDDIAQCDGDREKLLGRIMERYGCTHEQAEQQVSTWQRAS